MICTKCSKDVLMLFEGSICWKCHNALTPAERKKHPNGNRRWGTIHMKKSPMRHANRKRHAAIQAIREINEQRDS